MNGFLLFDSQDRVLKISENVLALLGYESSQIDSLDWQSLVVEDSDSFKPKLGEVVELPGFLKRHNGEIAQARLRSQRLDVGAGIYVVEVTVADAVQQDEDSEAHSLSFLTTVSHELRVALNGVIGFSNLLGSTVLDAEQKANLDKLQSCNSLLKGLVNDILEYSRVASAKIDLTGEHVRLAEFVEDVAGLFHERARKKGLDLQVEAEPEAAIEVTLAKLRVTQVLSNLISNAIKFTDSGWIRISTRIEGAWICLDVLDTGRGIEQSDVTSLFRPFVQSNANGGIDEGSGLGLSISKSLVEKMGGTLLYKRPSGVGSLFEARLPLVRATGEEPVKRSASSGRFGGAADRNESTPSRAGKRILVVEDNQLNADILGHFLQDYGIGYDVVDNGQSAVDEYQEGKYDLILMDVMLPELNGYEATQKILARCRRQPPVPIVGVTAKVFRKDQMLCLEAGMVEVVHKPVDFKLLREVLDFHLFNERRVRARIGATEQVSAKLVKKPGSATPADSVIDGVALENYIDRMKTDSNGRQDVVDTALEIVDAEVERLIESIEKGERKETALRAHSLKGALALLGARNLLELSKGLEAIADDESRRLHANHWKNLISISYAEFRGALCARIDSSAVV